MCAAQACAFAVSTECSCRAASPRVARSELILAMKSDSAAGSAAFAPWLVEMTNAAVATIMIAAISRRIMGCFLSRLAGVWGGHPCGGAGVRVVLSAVLRIGNQGRDLDPTGLRRPWWGTPTRLVSGPARSP